MKQSSLQHSAVTIIAGCPQPQYCNRFHITRAMQLISFFVEPLRAFKYSEILVCRLQVPTLDLLG